MLVLTHDSQLNGITGSLSLCVCGHACVIAGVVPRYSLKDETVVADDHTRAHVLHYFTVLETKINIDVLNDARIKTKQDDYNQFSFSTVPSIFRLDMKEH